ncbi:hypothetical protein SAMN05421543_12217 [Alicyclobacillus macrosporangiidus]|uniref:Uncharacterized protein n=1 Tax=Alicyclobacillus macrosporangiidus TaxID=392015 RepID=A0A1I7L012_9BACL|nr:hypothetical protein SAMN05421543_12217 [Alicyclobacillus macrosporangiidus]
MFIFIFFIFGVHHLETPFFRGEHRSSGLHVLPDRNDGLRRSYGPRICMSDWHVRLACQTCTDEQDCPKKLRRYTQNRKMYAQQAERREREAGTCYFVWEK